MNKLNITRGNYLAQSSQVHKDKSQARSLVVATQNNLALVHSLSLGRSLGPLLSQQSIRGAMALNDGAIRNIYRAPVLSESSKPNIVAQQMIPYIVSNTGVNSSAVYALAMLKVYSSYALAMKNSADWSEQLIQIMDSLNCCMLELSNNLQIIISELAAQHQRELISATRTSGLIGILISGTMLAIGLAMCFPVPTPMGVVLVINSLCSMLGNCAKISDPEGALKEDSWQNSLAANGLFAIFDLGAKGAGEKAQGIATVLMLVLSEGSSAISALSNRALLSTSQMVCKSLLLLESSLRAVGITLGLFQDNAGSANTQHNLSTILSMGLVGGTLHEILKLSTDNHESSIALLLGSLASAGVGSAFQGGLQYGAFNLLEDDMKYARSIRNVEKLFNATNQQKTVNNAVLRGENSYKDSASQTFLATNKLIEKHYALMKSRITLITKEFNQRNDGLMTDKQGLLDIVKQVEQIFAHIFAPRIGRY